jgi:WD40 repeat protein
MLIILAVLLAEALADGPPSSEIILQSGHGANISALAFSPDGKFLVSASEDSTLRLWDPNTGAALRILRGHSNIVTAVAVSGNGTQIASASLDHTLRVWNPVTGEQLASFRGPEPSVYLLKITPDSHSLITAETVATGTVLRVWDIKNGRQMRMIKREDAAVSHVFFRGAMLLVAEESGEDDSSGSLTTYNLQNGRQIQTRPTLVCGASDDGKWIAIDRSNETARRAVIFDLARDRPLDTLSGQVSRVVFSSTGNWLAYESLAGDTAVVRRTAGGPARTIHGRGAEFSMLALSPDGRRLATAGADFSIHIWDVDTGRLAHGASGQYTPSVIAFSPDAQHMAVNGGGTDLGSALQIWDIAHKTQLPGPRLKLPVAGLTFSRDGAFLAVSASALEVFDTRTEASVAKLDCGSAAALSPVFSPNGKWVAATCGGMVTVWSLSGGAESFYLGEVSDANHGPVLFNPDGQLLAVGSTTGLTLYDVASRKIVQSLKTTDAVSALAFSANGEWLAFGMRLNVPKTDENQPSLSLLEMRTRRRVWSAPAGQWVTALNFPPDGHGLLVAAGSVRLFDTVSGRPIRTVLAKIPNSVATAFSADGEWLGVGWNSATHVWRLHGI